MSGPKSETTSPFSVVCPPNKEIFEVVRKQAGDSEMRIDAFAASIAKDPVIAIELLRAANSMEVAGDRTALTSIKAAIERLGGAAIVEALDRLKNAPQIENEDQAKWFEKQRKYSFQISEAALTLAGFLAAKFRNECQAAGLMMRTGDLVAILHLGEQYVALARENVRNKVHYRLEKDHNFSVEAIGVEYLRRLGMPEDVLFCVDRDSQSKTKTDRNVAKGICQAAHEFVTAIETDKWNKYAPGETLPPKSAVRMLQIPAHQYESIYTKLSGLLLPQV